jgi:2,4-dienoyl-CoA reductase-like NADH-dependent reductase (Old Yellow Enzyme family)
MSDVDLLFQPLQVRGRRLPNRIVMPPMVVNRGIDTHEGIAWYGSRARGGAGLVIVEATNVTGFASQFSSDRLRPLVDAIHAGGALAAIQLFPGVRGQHIAPADVDGPWIEGLLDAFAAATAICVEAGFDGVEIHGAHGFLLNQFFSSTQNKRMDAYGVTLGGRMLLGVQVVRAVRSALPDDRILLYRHTPVGTGYSMEESLELAHALVDAGVDILDLSPSSIDAPGDRAAPFRILGVPVITVNDLEQPGRAVEALREGRADLVAIGRGLIADPQWPAHVRESTAPVDCAKCDRCHADLGRGEAVRCIQWGADEP